MEVDRMRFVEIADPWPIRSDLQKPKTNVVSDHRILLKFET